MTLSQLGYISLEKGEQVIAGDPCYFDDTQYALKHIDTGWETGKYAVWLDHDDGGPTHLFLLHPDLLYPMVLNDYKEIGWLGVDSGQLGFVGAKYFAKWVENDAVLIDNPVCDYDYACNATLRSEHGASILANTVIETHNGLPVGMAAASGTRYGDGSYQLQGFYHTGKLLQLAIVFESPYDSDEDDEYWDDGDDWDDDDRDCPDGYEYDDEGCVETGSYDDE